MGWLWSNCISLGYSCFLASDVWTVARVARGLARTDRQVGSTSPFLEFPTACLTIPIWPATRCLWAAQSGDACTGSIFSGIINFKHSHCYYCDACHSPERQAREALLDPAPPDRILRRVESMEFALLEICSTSPVFRRPSLVVVMTRHAETLALLIAIFETTRKRRRRKHGALLPASDSPREVCVHLRAKTIPHLTAKSSGGAPLPTAAPQASV